MTCLLLAFSGKVDLSEFQCSFLSTEHVSLEMPVLKGRPSVPMMHLKSHFVIKLYFFIQMDFG